MIFSLVSYRGGSGKSMLALNLGYILQSDVLLIEADFLAPSYAYLFPKVSHFWNDYLLNRDQSGDILHRYVGADIICTRPDDQELYTLIQNKKLWGGSFSDRIARFLSEKRGEYDYIIIDNQGGEFLSTVVHSFYSDFLICVIRPDLFDVRGTASYLTKLKKDFYIVWNNVLDYDEMHEYITEWTDTYFVSMEKYRGTLGTIHLDQEAALQRWTQQKIILHSTQYLENVNQIATNLRKLRDEKISTT